MRCNNDAASNNGASSRPGRSGNRGRRGSRPPVEEVDRRRSQVKHLPDAAGPHSEEAIGATSDHYQTACTVLPKLAAAPSVGRLL